MDTYPVEGDDFQAIAVSLRSGGVVNDGVRTAGYHRWKLKWNYRSRMEVGLCVINSVTLTVESTITLPLWRPSSSAHSDLSTYWNAYLSALITHEVGHRTIALAGASEIRERLMTLNAPRCDQISMMVQTQVDQMIARINAENSQYDVSTRKGGTQGATWPPQNRVR